MTETGQCLYSERGDYPLADIIGTLWYQHSPQDRSLYTPSDDIHISLHTEEMR